MTGRIEFAADLSFQVDDGIRQTTARITGAGADLVLDVDDPSTLWRALPRAGGIRQLSRQLPTDRLAGTSLDVRSHGRSLGTVTVSGRRRLRVRPTPAGLGASVAAAISSRSGRALAIAMVAVVLAGPVRRLARRG